MNNVKTVVIIGGVLVLMVGVLIFLNREKFTFKKQAEVEPAAEEE